MDVRNLVLIGILLVAVGLTFIPRGGITTPQEVIASAPEGKAVSACAMGFVVPLLGILSIGLDKKWIKLMKNGQNGRNPGGIDQKRDKTLLFIGLSLFLCSFAGLVRLCKAFS